MQTTGRRAAGLAVVAAVFFLGSVVYAAQKTPFAALAGLATALSENDPDSALDFFDSKMAAYPDIELKIEALTDQDDISCSIDIVTDTESAGVHKLDLDWFMQLKSQSDSAQLEQRRVRVQVEMRQIKGAWKITSLTPGTIFDPISIR